MSELTQRILTVVVGAPIIIYAVYVGGWPLALLALLLATVAAVEFRAVAASLWGAWWPLPSMAAGWAVIVCAAVYGPPGWGWGLLAGVLALGVWAVLRGAAHRPRQAAAAWSAAVAYVVAIPALLAFFPLLRAWGRPALLWPLAVVWLSDMAAYFGGRALGRHRLAPRLSPGKTWEGFAAAVVVGALAGWGFAVLAHLPPQLLVPESAGLVVAGTVGDLFQSTFKRAAARKDSGHLLPGHGGVWDRFDSLAFALPVAWWLVQRWS